VLEAGRFASSAGNCQGWKFVVVTDNALMQDMSLASLKFRAIITKRYLGKGPLRSTIKKSLSLRHVP
jgi:nitroreductase